MSVHIIQKNSRFTNKNMQSFVQPTEKKYPTDFCDDEYNNVHVNFFGS